MSGRRLSGIANSNWDTPGSDGVARMHYFERRFDMQATKVLPGEYYAADDERMLITVLGSCVSACLHDPTLGIGGMNHFMLPDTRVGVASASARYGGYAMELLINDMLKLGAVRSRLVAKIFGGGNVLRSLTASNVGTRNVEFVHDYLKAEHIPIIAEDVLDTVPRKVVFFPRTGKALIQRLANKVAADSLADETAYGKRLHNVPLQGGVELFQ